MSPSSSRYDQKRIRTEPSGTAHAARAAAVSRSTSAATSVRSAPTTSNAVTRLWTSTRASTPPHPATIVRSPSISWSSRTSAPSGSSDAGSSTAPAPRRSSGPPHPQQHGVVPCPIDGERTHQVLQRLRQRLTVEAGGSGGKRVHTGVDDLAAAFDEAVREHQQRAGRRQGDVGGAGRGRIVHADGWG